MRTSLLNCCRLPRNSPIICLLRPFLSRMNRATPTGVSDTKPLSIRYWIPFSGFLRLKVDHLGFGLTSESQRRPQTRPYLLKRLSPMRYCRRCTTSLLKAGESQLWRLSR